MSQVDHERFFSLAAQGIEEPQQRTPEWFEKRKNKLSGSKLSNFLFCKTDEELDQWIEEVRQYIIEDWDERGTPPMVGQNIEDIKKTTDSERIVLYKTCNAKLGFMGSISCGVPNINTNPIAKAIRGFLMLERTSKRTWIFCFLL